MIGGLYTVSFRALGGPRDIPEGSQWWWERRREGASDETPGFNSMEAAQLFILRTNWSSFLIKGVF